jgi:hypothetical protein
VLCRTILSALAASGLRGSETEDGGGDRRRGCESLFVDCLHIFRDLAPDKIASGRFALPLGYVRSILIGEDELIRTIGGRAQTH